jgi:hypothetical protein
MKKIVPVLFLSVLLYGTAFTQGIKSLSFQNYSSGVSLSRLHSNYAVSGRIQPGINLSLNPDIGDYKSWESEKHFLAAAGELALLEFIPWAMARW